MKNTDSDKRINCKDIISGKFLAKRPQQRFKVQLERLDNGELFSGVLELLSPIGIVLKSDVPRGKYKIRLINDLEVIVKTVNLEGTAPYQSFDITKVIREEEERGRLSKEDFELLTYSSKEIINKLTESLAQDSQELIREQLKAEIEKSELLDELEIADVFKYDRGKIKNLTGYGSITLGEAYLSNFIKKSLKDGHYSREMTVDETGDRIYDLHAVPMDYKSAGMIAIDVTDIINTERKNKARELEIYRDVIEAATNGKFKLIFKEDELSKLLEKGSRLFSADIKKAEDIKIIRDIFKAEIKEFNFGAKEELHLTLALSEAMTNGLKHGGAAKVLANHYQNKLRIIVSDQGTGIDFKELPKATLMKNYSGAENFSLGQGFSVMFMASDCLFLKTDKRGTIVILEKEVKEGGVGNE